MSTQRWTAEEELLLKTLLPTNSFEEIAQQFERRVKADLPGFKTTRSADAVRRKCERENWTATNTQGKTRLDVDDRWDALAQLNARHAAAAQIRSPGVMKPEQATRKILVLSDIHFPIARTDLLESIVEQHGDAEICVLNGDIIEGYIFSSFPKEKRIAAIDEYNAALHFISILSQKFKHVFLVEGNHDARPTKYLSQKDMTDDVWTVLRPNLLARLANGEVLDRTGMLVEQLDFSNVHFDPNESYYVKIGKAIIFHPSTMGSDKPGWTVTTMGPKIGRRYQDGEVDTYVCGHTHKIFKGVENGKLFIEQGCLAGLLTYFFKPSNASTRHYQNGYCVLYQDKDGNTDFNRSGPVYLGECLPPKKEAKL
jgi:predicted phosphodiesterase